MANPEGAVRIRRLGKVLVLGGLTFTCVGALILVIGWRSLQRYVPLHQPQTMLQMYAPAVLQLGLIFFAYLGILPQAIGALLYLSAWIAEGFLLPRMPE